VADTGLSARALPGVRFIPAEPGSSEAEMRALGIAHATGDVVALTNDVAPSLERCGALARLREPDDRDDAPAAAEPAPVGLSVVVVARGDAGALEQCLRALRASELLSPGWELLVVDDGTTEPTAAVAARYADVVVRLPGRPFGPNYARNRGAEAARGAVLVFVDAEVCVRPDTVARFADCFEADARLGAVVGSFDCFPADTRMVSQHRQLAHHFRHRGEAGETQALWAGCSAVRRAALAEAGMFDEWRSARRDDDDVELGARIVGHGYKLVLRADIQATSSRKWTLREALAADLRGSQASAMHRAGRRAGGVVEGRAGGRALAWLALSLSVAGGALASVPLAGAGAAAVLTMASLDRRRYAFFASQRGPLFAAAAVPIDLLYHLTSSVGNALGWMTRELVGEPSPDPSLQAFAECGVRTWPPVPTRRT
jgi:hypothetical protein